MFSVNSSEKLSWWVRGSQLETGEELSMCLTNSFYDQRHRLTCEVPRVTEK